MMRNLPTFSRLLPTKKQLAIKAPRLTGGTEIVRRRYTVSMKRRMT
jgi:hypothetical protein